MRIPDPKANTTTEAYLAYKAGFLTQGELKPVLYEPYLHFDAWLAYWCGLTNTYPLNEAGEPEMLCDEEALVAYLSGVTDTYPEEIKDPYDVRIVGYLRHIANGELPAPDYPVNNSEFYLSELGNAEEESVFTALPGTFNSSGQYLIDYTIYGNTLNGGYDSDAVRNLFDKDRSYSEVSRLINVSGEIAINSAFSVTGFYPVTPNTIYTLQSVNVNSSSPAVCFYDLDKQFISGEAYAGSPNKTFTTPNDCYFIKFSVRKEQASSAMLHIGGDIIDYKAFSGDCGDQTRNLLDKSGPWNYTQRYLNSSGRTASNSGFNVTDFVQVAPNTVYRLQSVNESSSNPAICFYDENKEYISGIAYNKAVSITVTTPANCMYVRFSVKRDLLDSAMFHLGGTDIAYEPYGFLLPISMNGTTTVVTLRYPLRKIGDVADYINYAEQKMYQYINNGTVLDNPIVRSITLPEIGISAENTVDVLTMVKPSKVVLKYDKA